MSTMPPYVNYSDMITTDVNEKVKKVHLVAREHQGPPVNFNHRSVYLEIEDGRSVELIMDPGDDNDDYRGTLLFVSWDYKYRHGYKKRITLDVNGIKGCDTSKIVSFRKKCTNTSFSRHQAIIIMIMRKL